MMTIKFEKVQGDNKRYNVNVETGAWGGLSWPLATVVDDRGYARGWRVEWTGGRFTYVPTLLAARELLDKWAMRKLHAAAQLQTNLGGDDGGQS